MTTENNCVHLICFGRYTARWVRYVFEKTKNTTFFQCFKITYNLILIIIYIYIYYIIKHDYYDVSLEFMFILLQMAQTVSHARSVGPPLPQEGFYGCQIRFQGVHLFCGENLIDSKKKMISPQLLMYGHRRFVSVSIE